MNQSGQVLDFRSDTLTQPCDGMRQAMAQARVGDDVFGEDPTVKELEQRTAELFGRQAALFVPSGTMANLIGLALHCDRGHEVIMERRTHSFAHEVGGGAALLGILFKTVSSSSGYIQAEQIEPAIRMRDVHQPISRLVVVENSANLCGGKIVPFKDMVALRELTSKQSMALHLDGARIWNASVASGIPLSRWAAQVDSLSCCLSKAMGCPVGSLLIGDGEAMDKARWLRKMLGGGMRQAGVLAACGLFALDHNLERLAHDHQLAAELAQGLEQTLGQEYQVQAPETNMVLVHTRDKQHTDDTLADWRERGIMCLPVSDTSIRLVSHKDLPPDAPAQVLQRLSKP